MKYILILCLFTIGCATTYKAGSPEYIEHQVYQCRRLCSAGTVDITAIKGLQCVCNTRQQQQPIIINNVPQPMTYTSIYPKEYIVQKEVKTGLQIKTNATVLERHDGKKIYSQNKY